MFIYLVNESHSSPNLGMTINQTKPKHNNVFRNKLTNMRLCNNIIC